MECTMSRHIDTIDGSCDTTVSSTSLPFTPSACVQPASKLTFHLPGPVKMPKPVKWGNEPETGCAIYILQCSPVSQMPDPTDRPSTSIHVTHATSPENSTEWDGDASTSHVILNNNVFNHLRTTIPQRAQAMGDEHGATRYTMLAHG